MLGEKIKKAREGKGYSQNELAELVFITKQSISKYENNKAVPTSHVLEKLEEALDVKLSITPKRFSLIMHKLVIVVLTLVSITSLTLVYSLNNKLDDYDYLSSKRSIETDNIIISYIDSEASVGDSSIWVKISFDVKNTDPNEIESKIFDVQSLSLTNGRIKNIEYSLDNNRPQIDTYIYSSQYVMENNPIVIWVEFDMGVPSEVEEVLNNTTALTYNGETLTIIRPKTQ